MDSELLNNPPLSFVPTRHERMIWQSDKGDLASIKSMLSADPDLVYLR